MLAACTSESENGPSANISFESIAATQQVPVTFGTYIGDQATTRAGKTGSIDTDVLKLAQGSGGGFGVFGYYTDHSDYVASGGSASPVNFMYNQGVFWNSKWEYTPVKYWPNETNATNGTQGQVDGSATSSGGPDKLTFFAYAPYVSSPSYDGVVSPTTYGITALTSNATDGDPKVNYAFSDDALNSVDLLWAVAPANQTTPTVSGGDWSNVLAGKPYINLVKPKLTNSPSVGSNPINFSFKHALAKLKLTVQAANDQVAAGGTEFTAAETKIVIEKVELTGNFPTSATLNLNNTTANVPKWEYAADPSAQTLEISTAKANLNSDLAYETGKKASQHTANGVVTTSPKVLMKNTSDNEVYFMFIPHSTQTNVTVKITYYVITDDAALNDEYISVKNVIQKLITPLNFVAGNEYTLNIVLGMETVDFTATVEAWTTTGNTVAVDLPINVVTPPAP